MISIDHHIRGIKPPVPGSTSPYRRKSLLFSNIAEESPTKACQKLTSTLCPMYEIMLAYGYMTAENKGIPLSLTASPTSSPQISKKFTYTDIFYPAIMATLPFRVINLALEELLFYYENRDKDPEDLLTTEDPSSSQPYTAEFDLFVRRMLGSRINKMFTGEVVGERALNEQQQPRTASVVSMTACDFLTISKEDYDSYLKRKLQRKIELKHQFISNNFPIVSTFTREEYYTLQSEFKDVIRKRGDISLLIDENKISNFCCIVSVGKQSSI